MPRRPPHNALPACCWASLKKVTLLVSEIEIYPSYTAFFVVVFVLWRYYMSTESRMFLICKVTQMKSATVAQITVFFLSQLSAYRWCVWNGCGTLTQTAESAKRTVVFKVKLRSQKSFITLGFFGRFHIKLCVPVMWAVFQPNLGKTAKLQCSFKFFIFIFIFFRRCVLAFYIFGSHLKRDFIFTRWSIVCAAARDNWLSSEVNTW